MKKSMDLDTVRAARISSKNVVKQLVGSSVGTAQIVLAVVRNHAQIYVEDTCLRDSLHGYLARTPKLNSHSLGVPFVTKLRGVGA